MNNNVMKYLKDVKSLFPVFQKEEKAFFEKFMQTIKKETGQSSFTYQDCVEKFGFPKEIIINYYEEMNSDNLLKRVYNQHMFRKMFYVLCIAIVIISLITCVLLYKSYQEVKDGHVTKIETTTEIIE